MAAFIGTSPVHGVSVYRVKSDINGNPRYVVHYLAAPEPPKRADDSFRDHQNAHIAQAKKVFYGNLYRGRDFGGGIVFSTYQNPFDYVDWCIDNTK